MLKIWLNTLNILKIFSFKNEEIKDKKIEIKYYKKEDQAIL